MHPRSSLDVTQALADALVLRSLLVSDLDAECLTVSAKPLPGAKVAAPRRVPCAPLQGALSALTPHQTSADPSPTPSTDPRRLISGFADGVAAAVLAPRQVSMQELSFEASAGRLLMRLEGPLFIDGMRAADAEEPIHQPWHDALSIVYWLDLDRGQRPIPSTRFKAWNVTLDQLHCGARSLLFHRSRDIAPEPLPAHPTVARLHLGDGFDAARALVLEEIDWQRAADGLRLSVPSPDTLLVQALSAPLSDLADATAALYAATERPLSAQLFNQRGSRLTPA
jgi:hypothetical protein